MELVGLNQIADRFSEIHRDLQRLALQLQARCPRTEKNLALHNILIAASRSAHRMTLFISDESLDAIAWSTRCLYELVVALEFVLGSDVNVEIWMRRNLVKDEIEILEGMLTMDRPGVEEHSKAIRARIAILESLAAKHGFKAEKQKTVAAMAALAGAGMAGEHAAFYKLYSKYTHPSSWLVNMPLEDAHDMDKRNVFINRAQVAAIAILGIIARSLGWASEWPEYEVLER